MDQTILEFSEKIQYTFQNEEFLQNALTHSSYAYEKNSPQVKSNERMEFLGDSVLSVTMSEYLYRHFEDLPEGELSKIRARIVCEETLFKAAQDLEIGKNLLLGHGEEQMGGREKASLLSDAFEALLAAIFLDGGIDTARNWVLSVLKDSITLAVEGKILTDYKTDLQEKIQKNPNDRLEYVLEKEEGPDHNKKFTVNVLLNGAPLGSGEGKSKKDAEQSAAKAALLNWAES